MNLKIININLQQALVMHNNSIIAATSKHNNTIVINKPLILDKGVEQLIIDKACENNLISNNSKLVSKDKLNKIFTDSFSIGFFNPNTYQTSLI